MQIVPIRDLRDTNAISEKCHQSQEPIFVTKNGYGDMVVMSMEAYERTFAMVDLYKKLAEAEKELAEGKALPGAKAMEELRQRYSEGGNIKNQR